MVKKMVLGLAVMFVIAVSLNLALAKDEKSLLDQELEQKQKYDKLYDKGRFDVADTNGDGNLSKDELEAARANFEYRDEKRFQHADANNDGVISEDEAKAERKWEKARYERLNKDQKDELGDKEDKLEPYSPEKVSGKVIYKKFGTVQGK